MVRSCVLLFAVFCAALSFKAIAVRAHSAERQHNSGHPAPASAPSASPPTAIIESAARIQPPPDGYNFSNGRNFVYSAEWRLFNAGTAILHTEVKGPEAQIVLSADAVGAVALLYHVHDRMETTLNPKTFCSTSIKKHTEEGFRRVDTNLRLDYRLKKAIFDEKNMKTNTSRHLEGEIPDCVTDVISGILYSGTVPAEPGKQFTFPLNDGGRTVDVLVRAEAREEVKVPAGTYKAIRLQPEAMNGPLKGKGKIWIWYSDDASHIPVQMRAKMFWGTLNFKLQRIEQSGK